MNKMKTFMLTAIMAMAGATITSCTDYQDEIDALDYRITVLENLQREMNVNLQATQTIVTSLDNGDYITNVTPIENGYIITFHNAGAITILNGRDGVDGQDAQTPDIGIEQDTDGNYYWTLNGQWLLVGGQKVRANGHDGRDGEDGKSTAPQVRINDDGVWEISTDGGLTWVSTGVSAKGRDGRDGRDGQDGKDADPIIESVTVTVLGDGTRVVTFKMGNGLTFTIPLID